MHLTMAQSFSAISTVAVARVMVRLGAAKGALQVKVADRCAACGRKRTHGRCPCAGGE
jgi:hypothetical protein